MQRVLVIETRYHRPFSAREKDLMLNDWDEILLEVGPLAFDNALDACSKNEAFYSLAKFREYAGLRKQELDEAEAMEAWRWITEKIVLHGVSWHPVAAKARERVENCAECANSGWKMVMKGDLGNQRREATKCECSITQSVPAPEIPERIEYALQQLGKTREQGLERIAKCPELKVAFVRKEFVQAYKLSELVLQKRPQLVMKLSGKALPAQVG